ncbi:hypothetical protein COU37_02995 [Candidatus Micrarchaeota archaeon CG10_big_fil_rev_8_21_14_0_10_45_29]|nr:MAG: hypothetical protein COU37_02995 [Candidatus Micrarchaeota archaeon CG10_big_fil_rev_8_21_14_0_10_45_29]QBM01546.1 hypothetical protein [uncultured archaeon]
MLGNLFVDDESAKVLDYLLDFPQDSFSKKDLMSSTNVSFHKINRIIEPLKHFGIIVENKRIARAVLYKLNTDNEIFRELLRLDKKISVV